MTQGWPWYVGGPLIGLFVPVLLLVGNRLFGVSSNFRHLCAVALPTSSSFLRYDWKRVGSWNLAFSLGIVFGGMLTALLLGGTETTGISATAQHSLSALGIRDFHGLVPQELFSWHALTTVRGLIMIVGGGFLVGFGTAYAGGCTSGHAISGLADLQLPSLLAVIGFFAGGLFTTFIIMPRLLVG
jgi:uncharacterized protein